MAAPITHIILANKIFGKYFKGKDKQLFFIGTSFPDIGYLGVAQREGTHHKITSIKELAKENPFNVGLKFHSLLDEIRKSFTSRYEKDIFDSDSNTNFRALTLLEDEIFYKEIANWEQFSSCFNTILQEERAFGIEEGYIKKWHMCLRDYLLKKPDDASRTRFMEVLNFTQKDIQDINETLNKLKSNPKVKKMIEEFYSSFEQLVNQ